jgi:hypothetical protein
MEEIIITHVQMCAGESDITNELHAASDAECVRYWSDDMCVLEVVRKETEKWTFGPWRARSSDIWIFSNDEMDMRESYRADLLSTMAGNRGCGIGFSDI